LSVLNQLLTLSSLLWTVNNGIAFGKAQPGIVCL